MRFFNRWFLKLSEEKGPLVLFLNHKWRISAGKVDKRQADTEQPKLFLSLQKAFEHISSAGLTKSHISITGIKCTPSTRTYDGQLKKLKVIYAVELETSSSLFCSCLKPFVSHRDNLHAAEARVHFSIYTYTIFFFFTKNVYSLRCVTDVGVKNWFYIVLCCP